MRQRNFNTSFSVSDVFGTSEVFTVAKPEILIVDAAPVQTTVEDETKPDATEKPADNGAPTKKERPKWLQWAVEHKAILICGGIALLLWVGFKKGFINWN